MYQLCCNSTYVVVRECMLTLRVRRTKVPLKYQMH
jgi:hypothetical protein